MSIIKKSILLNKKLKLKLGLKNIRILRSVYKYEIFNEKKVNLQLQVPQN